MIKPCGKLNIRVAAIRFFSLLVAVFGVVLFRILPDWWCQLAWIPISVGFNFYHRWE
jgi:hypothetical protein